MRYINAIPLPLPLRVEIAPEDPPFLRFLWRDLDVQKATEEYEFSHVASGENWSPFLAEFVTEYHAEGHRSEYAVATETAFKSKHMDNSMDSVTDDRQGIELYIQLSKHWKGAGM